MDTRQRSSDSKLSIAESTDKGEESDVSTDGMSNFNMESRFLRTINIRRESIARRSSEGSDRGDSITGPRRQLSMHSEPDTSDNNDRGGTERSVTFAEPKITVIPPSTSSNARAQMLMALHTEYTSITDEIESVCGLLSPPRTPRLLSPPRPNQISMCPRKRHASEMSNPEIALYIEKEHLRDAEENDYLLMENLIQRRYDENEDESFDQNPQLLTVVQETREFRNSPRSLRRSSAIEVEAPRFSSARELEVPGRKEVSLPSCSKEQTVVTIISKDRKQSQNSESSSLDDDTTFLVSEGSSNNLRRPTIVIDGSQLPTLQRKLPKTDSKSSLHMQSETMC